MAEFIRSLTTPPWDTEIQLYQGLLDCLEEEWLALIHAREEALLALAARKEEILRLISDLRGHPASGGWGPRPRELLQLHQKVADGQARNLRLAHAALEVIQDFLDQLNASPPGLYQGAGKLEPPPGTSFFHRQA